MGDTLSLASLPTMLQDTLRCIVGIEVDYGVKLTIDDTIGNDVKDNAGDTVINIVGIEVDDDVKLIIDDA